MCSQQRPLQNHLIISNVAKYLKFKELKNFRLVCRQWNLSSKPFYQHKSCVIFKSDDGRTRIRKFLKEKFDIFVNFKFIDIDFRDKYRKIFTFFAEQLGCVVREVAIVKCEADYAEILNHFKNLNVLSIALPPICNEDNVNNNIEMESQSKIATNLNVKCLEITGRLVEGNVNEFCWNNLIQAFPNTEIFGGQCRGSEDLTALLSTLSSGQSSPLGKLSDFSCVLTDLHNSHLEMLFSISSNLTNIDLSLAESVDASLLTTLLGKYAVILKSIKLFRDSNIPLILFKGQDANYSFKSLVTLEIPCNMIASLDFLQLTPILKNFSLTQFGDGDVTFHNVLVRNSNPRLVFENLQSFSFEYFLAPDCIQNVLKMFPNLKRLSTYLTDDTARAVFQDGLLLQELIVLGTQLSDEGITGVPLNLLERKYRFMKDYRKNPYIGDLKNLWRLVLYPQPQEKITDLSVIYGFMDVGNLTCIDIPETAISDEGIETLQRKSNLVTLISPFYTPDGCIYSRPIELQQLR
ncbi:unnamed protein product [Allacma fusca]|uniref:F-box domain-containing protein n=1 Tax=Allacma fusca TaxID=39272 RepID=A0A8J2K004_9HEXA|nr:unnamed protein product [Allacma fusca]